MMLLHINCDVGESYHDKLVGNDAMVIPLADAVNIACGGHGGDPLTILRAISLALSLYKEIGAHPSYPDIEGFGRKYVSMPSADLDACLRYQIGAVKAMTESLGGRLSHVKAHGALYNRAAIDPVEASVFLDAVYAIDAGLRVFAPSGSIMAMLAHERGMTVVKEAFADRMYLDDGTLASRQVEGAVIADTGGVVEQVRHLLDGKAKTLGGTLIALPSDTICVHGDQENATSILQAMHQEFRKANEV